MNQRRVMISPEARTAVQQPRKLVLALVLLVVALIAVLIKDRDFWFGGEQATIESDMPASQTAARKVTPAATPTRAVPTAPAKKQIAAPKTAVEQNSTEAPVAVNRTVLPPLDVEVIAGDAHKKLRPGTRITHVEIPNPSIQAESEAPTNAAEREPMVQPTQAQSYPLLAQHTSVQGSVVLQALIGADGIIENLRVVSGPAILAAAAQQAVREWRFKPILQHGQAVESKAQITVNFSIKVADNSAKTTLAESRISDTLIITR